MGVKFLYNTNGKRQTEACRFHHEGMKKLFTLAFVSLTTIRRTNAEKVTAKERKNNG